MGHFLKPKPTTLTGAKLRYNLAIARAEEQYEKALKEIGRREQEAREKPATLSVRTRNCLVNDGLVEWRYPQPLTDELIDPKSLSDLGAERLLKIPNFGYKCLAEVDVWLKQRGFELKP